MKRAICLLAACAAAAMAEQPGEFRPKPVVPAEKVGAHGLVVQPPDAMPRSRAPLGVAQRKAKLAQKPAPALRGGNELVLNAGWELAEAPQVQAGGAALSMPGVDTRAWYDATVPGTVMGTLVEQGVYPDPYFGLNNLAIPESLCRQDYWYRTEFAVPASFTGRTLQLQFQGINYYAEVWLNGEYLGHVTGAFIRGLFDVTRHIKPGALNVLAVQIAPPPDPGVPSEQSVKFGPGGNGGAMCLDGPTFVCSEGWDWIPALRDRCSGLWQDVILRAGGAVAIGDPQVVTDLPLPDTASADVTVAAELRNTTDAAQSGMLEGEFEGVRFSQPVRLQPGETKTVVCAPKEFPQLHLRRPRLWWPNGYGKPELYHLQLRFVAGDGKESDRAALRFGVREMSYELAVKMPDGQVKRVEYTPTAARGAAQPVIDVRRASMGWDPPKHTPVTQVAVYAGAERSPALRPVEDAGMGPYLIVKVNGQRILCRGGNWGMEDALKRISRERMEPYMRLHRDANLTMIRNWAGQSTSETFYELCDEYGLLVWNDFWLNTEGWNYNPVDNELFLRNVADTLKRYRNHPSIALWCPRNEGVPPEPLNLGIDKLIRELDGTRHYQPNSRLVNLRKSGPWSNMPLEKYFKELNEGFSTELGASSIPSAEVMRSMMAPADLWPPEDAWAYHDFHSKGAGDSATILAMIARRYGEAKDLEDLCRKAQMVNYETYRAIFEGFNSKLWNSCSGVLVWMSHPSWPSVVWQFYSWDYEPNGALFGAKKASEPLHIQMTEPDGRVAVINHGAQRLTHLTAVATVRDLSGRVLDTRKGPLEAKADACTDVFTLAGPTNGAYFVTLELKNWFGRTLAENFYWRARDEKDLQQLNTLPAVTLEGDLDVERGSDGAVAVAELTNTSKTPALAVRLTLRDARTGARILPAYYSDDFFSLLPGESRTVRIGTRLQGAAVPPLKLSADGWNLAPSNWAE